MEKDLRDLVALKERLGVILKDRDPTPGKRPRFTGPQKVVNGVGVCQRGPVSEKIYGWGWKQYVEQMNSAAEICGHTTALYASLCGTPYLCQDALAIPVSNSSGQAPKLACHAEWRISVW